MNWMIGVAFSVAVSVFGTVKLFKPKVPLYFKMAVCASWCYTAQLLYQLCMLYCVGSSVGYSDNILSGLGTNAYAAFVFAANYGPFDSIMDGGNRKNRAVRLIALAAPTLFLGLTAVLTYFWYQSGEPFLEFIGYVALSASLMPGCVYFNLKYLLIRDDDVLIRGVRPINVCSLLFCFAFLAEMFASILGFTVLNDVFTYMLIGLAAATVFAADWGRRKWRS